MVKGLSERWVCATDSLSIGTSTSPRLSVSLRIPITEILLIAVIAFFSFPNCFVRAQPHTSLRSGIRVPYLANCPHLRLGQIRGKQNTWTRTRVDYAASHRCRSTPHHSRTCPPCRVEVSPHL